MRGSRGEAIKKFYRQTPSFGFEYVYWSYLSQSYAEFFITSQKLLFRLAHQENIFVNINFFAIFTSGIHPILSIFPIFHNFATAFYESILLGEFCATIFYFVMECFSQLNLPPPKTGALTILW